MQGRGLKQYLLDDHIGPDAVAPYAGAWIETIMIIDDLIKNAGRPLCRGVD